MALGGVICAVPRAELCSHGIPTDLTEMTPVLGNSPDWILTIYEKIFPVL